MTKANPLQSAVNAGEFSPRMYARTDFAKYRNAGRIVENLLPLPQGGLARRPGTRYIATGKDSTSARMRLLPFQFSTTQAYGLEAGNLYFRFYRNQGRITANNVTASITNGTFNTASTGWTDSSTGAASIAHAYVGSGTEGTWSASSSSNVTVGDATANSLSFGLKFSNTNAGTVTGVKLNVNSVTTSFNAVAGLYADNSGSPGTQVGGNSAAVSLASTGDKSFTWSANSPSLSASTTYWLVFTDTTGGGTGQITVTTCADQGSEFASGKHDTVTSIADQSGSFPAADDWKFEITVRPSNAEGVLELRATGSDVAVAAQTLTVDLATETIIGVDVRGVASDYVKMRIGTAAAGTDIINDRVLYKGYHLIAFTSSTVATVYLQFRNDTGKTVAIDNVDILDNEPVELRTPYTTAQLSGLKYAQSADELYIYHPSHEVMKLQRRGHTTWSLIEVNWQDGPYFDANTTTTTLAAGTATVGKGRTLTASATTGINDNQGFLSTDVGRLVRVAHTTNEPGWGIITAVTSTTVCTIDIIRAFNATSAVTTWRLGSWSDTTGFPACGAFFEQRLVAAATDDQPQTFWLSQSADLENLRPDSFVSSAVTVEDDDGLDFTIASDEVNAIRWLSPGQKLVIGTVGGEWVVKSTGAVVTPTDVDVKRQTTHGVADIQPVRVGSVVLFVQKALRKLREFTYDFGTDTYIAPDMTILADHITRGGIEEIAYQEEPDSILWAVRSDGQLLSMTYKREQEVVGWARHILGGAFGSGNAVVESVMTIPGNDGSGQTQDSTARNEVWLIVKRTINGSTARYVEMFEGGFEGVLRADYTTDALWQAALVDQQDDAYYSDSLLTYDGSAATSVTGLTHLEGQTVKVLGDGLVQSDKTVASGAITGLTSALVFQVGLSYTHRFETLKIEAGAQAGTSVGKTKRISRFEAILLDAAAFNWRYGLRGTAYTSSNPGNYVYTGERRIDVSNAGWTLDPTLAFEGSNPLSWTLLALSPHVMVQEGQ